MLGLKEEETLPWEDIAVQTFQVAALRVGLDREKAIFLAYIKYYST